MAIHCCMSNPCPVCTHPTPWHFLPPVVSPPGETVGQAIDRLLAMRPDQFGPLDLNCEES